MQRSIAATTGRLRPLQRTPVRRRPILPLLRHSSSTGVYGIATDARKTLVDRCEVNRCGGSGRCRRILAIRNTTAAGRPAAPGCNPTPAATGLPRPTAEGAIIGRIATPCLAPRLWHLLRLFHLLRRLLRRSLRRSRGALRRAGWASAASHLGRRC